MRRRVNWRWIALRLRRVTCWHRWGPGDGADPPHMACQKPGCGVWRWFPVKPA